MTKDIDKTKVVFRKYKASHNFGQEGVIVALFPELAFHHNGSTCECYEFCGQHGEADYSHVVNVMTVKATPAEYKDLKSHLEAEFGYNLDIKQKYIRARVK